MLERRNSRDRPSSSTRLSSSLTNHSRKKNGHRAPQDNGNGSNSMISSQDNNRGKRKRISRSNSETSTSHATRRSSNGRNYKTKPDGGGSSVGNNFSKYVVTLVMIIAIADLIVLWTSIDATIGDQNGDRPHQIGPEMGVHQFTAEKRVTDIQMQLMQDIAKKQQEQAKQQNPKKFRTLSENYIRRIEEQRRRQSQYAPIDKVKNVAKVNKVKNTDTFGVDEHIVKILTAANIQLDEELASQLPTWDDIVSMYGDKPIIYGLETCQTYRDTVLPADRMLGPAGIFNTGTNLLFELMKGNCNIKEAKTSTTHREPKRNGMRFQPPWGKVRNI